jgi:hypothetical protein
MLMTIDVELTRLRDALHEVHAADGGEESLRGAFRAHRAAIAQGAQVASAPQPPDRATPSSRARAFRRRNVDFIAGALAASIVIAAVVLVGLWRADRDGAESAATAAREASTPFEAEYDVGEIPVAAAFQPLSYSREISPTQAYTIVRVRVPLTALGLGYDAPPNATIEADLLLGEDGIPTGIRFDTTNAQLVSMATH